MAISLILNRGEKVKNVLMDSFLLKNNDNLIEDKIQKAVSNSDSKEDSSNNNLT